jgi:hypothetical protein
MLLVYVGPFDLNCDKKHLAILKLNGDVPSADLHARRKVRDSIILVGFLNQTDYALSDQLRIHTILLWWFSGN